LLVEIHPPSLETAGLEAALADLLSPLAAAGVATSLEVDDGAARGSAHDALVYRVAREALRNVAEHAGASSVHVRAARTGDRVVLAVADDGAGFDGARRPARAEEGHVGLTLLEDLVRGAGGTLDVRSAPGAGTTVVLEVPA
jgi:two-component system NarL family sensor kinase